MRAVMPLLTCEKEADFSRGPAYHGRPLESRPPIAAFGIDWSSRASRNARNFNSRWQVWVIGCRCDYVGSTTGVLQIADDLLHRKNWRRRATSGHSVCLGA